jgi:hypothetical protein
MTEITAKLLVASYDKKDMLPSATDPKHATNQSLSVGELPRIPLPSTWVNKGKGKGRKRHVPLSVG